MLETNPMPQEKLVARDMPQENDPDTESLCRLMGIDDSTERVGWLRYHLLLALAYLRGFILGFREVWFKDKGQE